MKALRIGVIAAAHVVALGIIYWISGLGESGGGELGVSTAGANGIANWRNDSQDSLAPTVQTSGIDSRAGDLTGYNAGEGYAATQRLAPEISSRERSAPRRPSGSTRNASGVRSAPSRGVQPGQSQQDVGILTPLSGPSRPSRQPPSIVAPSQPSQIIRYTIRSGDSLWAISNRFAVSREELQAVNPGLSVNIQAGQVINVPRSGGETTNERPISSSNSTPVAVSGNIYTVKSGDALSRIAANQGVTLSELRAANNLQGDLIRVGQKLVIPNGGREGLNPSQMNQRRGLQVVVAPGDSIFSIAERYSVSAKDLVLHNNISDPALINPGQTLFIPSRSSSGAARPSASPSSSAIREEPSKPPTRIETIPQDPPLTLFDEDEALTDEGLIDQPVIPIEN